jgi:hypothetical protein
VGELNMENTVSEKPTQIEINADLTHVRCVIAAMVEALTASDAPKSRERSLVVTKLEEAAMWANEGLRKE